MKLLYSGQSACDEATFKRLLMIGTELAFMDRPSVTFGKWERLDINRCFARWIPKGNQ